MNNIVDSNCRNFSYFLSQSFFPEAKADLRFSTSGLLALQS